MAEYRAFHYGKNNQSYKLEDENGRSVCEANLKSFKLFRASDYEFINRLTTSSVSRKVGKTITVNQGAAGFNMTATSYFKLDGKNCFSVLEEMGYTIKFMPKFDILHPEFALIDNNGSQIAVYRMNVTGEKAKAVIAFGNKQSNTLITTDSNDMDAIFLAAFIMSRVEFSRNLF